MGSASKTGPLNEEGASASFDLALALELSRMPDCEADCPGSDSIAAYYEGRLLVTEAFAQEKHLAQCLRCQGQVATLARADESADLPPPESARSESRVGVWMMALGLGVASAAGIALLTASRTRQIQPSLQEAQVQGTPAKSQAVISEVFGSNSIRAAQPHSELTTAPSAGKSRTRSAGSQAPAAYYGGAATRVAKGAALPPQLELKLVPESNTGFQKRPVESTLRGAALAVKRVETPEPDESTVEEDEPQDRTTLPPARFELSSPRESAYWRIGIDGSVAWSQDGDHWELQRQGDGASIESGMAADAFVCWLVGANGTILRSADGTTWSRVASPTSDNLISVSVRNAYVATITTSRGMRFRTTNGGRDWNPLLG